MRKQILTIVYLGLFIGCQSPTLESKIDSLLLPEFPIFATGATAMVAKNGKVLYTKAFGMANLELGVPMQPEMVFEIASITKQFTAVAILMLMEQGKLQLTDAITEYIPDYPTQGHTITIHHLLTHTSGIKSYTEMDTLTKIWRNDYTPQELINVFKTESMDFIPGSSYHYNDSGYILLGYIIEKLTGVTYQEFVETNIFQPIEMNSSHYANHAKIIKNRAAGYQKQDRLINAPYLNESLPYAAGSLLSTVGDLYKWNRAMKNNRFISDSAKQLAYTNFALTTGEKINYGYGWELNRLAERTSIAHSGGILGFITNVIYLPEEDLFIAVFSNCQCKNTVEISEKIAKLVLQEFH